MGPLHITHYGIANSYTHDKRSDQLDNLEIGEDLQCNDDIKIDKIINTFTELANVISI